MKRRGFLAGIGGAIGAAPLAKLFADAAEPASKPLQGGAEPTSAPHGVTCTINGHRFHVISVSGPQSYTDIDVASFDGIHPIYHSPDYGEVEVCCYPSRKVMDICRESIHKSRSVELVFHLGDDETTIHCRAVVTKYGIGADWDGPVKADIAFRMIGSSVVMT